MCELRRAIGLRHVPPEPERFVTSECLDGHDMRDVVGAPILDWSRCTKTAQHPIPQN